MKLSNVNLSPWYILEEVAKLLAPIQNDNPDVQVSGKPDGSGSTTTESVGYVHSNPYAEALKFKHEIDQCCWALPQLAEIFQFVDLSMECCRCLVDCQIFEWKENLRPATMGKLMSEKWRNDVIVNIHKPLCCLLEFIKTQHTQDVSTYEMVTEIPNFSYTGLPGFRYPIFLAPPLREFNFVNTHKTPPNKGSDYRIFGKTPFNSFSNTIFNMSASKIPLRLGLSGLSSIKAIICGSGSAVIRFKVNLPKGVLPDLSIAVDEIITVDECVAKFLPPMFMPKNKLSVLSLAGGEEIGIYNNVALQGSSYGSGFNPNLMKIPALLNSLNKNFDTKDFLESFAPNLLNLDIPLSASITGLNKLKEVLAQVAVSGMGGYSVGLNPSITNGSIDFGSVNADISTSFSPFTSSNAAMFGASNSGYSSSAGSSAGSSSSAGSNNFSITSQNTPFDKKNEKTFVPSSIGKIQVFDHEKYKCLDCTPSNWCVLDPKSYILIRVNPPRGEAKVLICSEPLLGVDNIMISNSEKKDFPESTSKKFFDIIDKVYDTKVQTANDMNQDIKCREGGIGKCDKPKIPRTPPEYKQPDNYKTQSCFNLLNELLFEKIKYIKDAFERDPSDDTVIQNNDSIKDINNLTKKYIYDTELNHSREDFGTEAFFYEIFEFYKLAEYTRNNYDTITEPSPDYTTLLNKMLKYFESDIVNDYRYILCATNNNPSDLIELDLPCPECEHLLIKMNVNVFNYSKIRYSPEVVQCEQLYCVDKPTNTSCPECLYMFFENSKKELFFNQHKYTLKELEECEKTCSKISIKDKDPKKEIDLICLACKDEAIGIIRFTENFRFDCYVNGLDITTLFRSIEDNISAYPHLIDYWEYEINEIKFVEENYSDDYLENYPRLNPEELWAYITYDEYLVLKETIKNDNFYTYLKWFKKDNKVELSRYKNKIINGYAYDKCEYEKCLGIKLTNEELECEACVSLIDFETGEYKDGYDACVEENCPGYCKECNKSDGTPKDSFYYNQSITNFDGTISVKKVLNSKKYLDCVLLNCTNNCLCEECKEHLPDTLLYNLYDGIPYFSLPDNIENISSECNPLLLQKSKDGNFVLNPDHPWIDCYISKCLSCSECDITGEVFGLSSQEYRDCVSCNCNNIIKVPSIVSSKECVGTNVTYPKPACSECNDSFIDKDGKKLILKDNKVYYLDPVTKKENEYSFNEINGVLVFEPSETYIRCVLVNCILSLSNIFCESCCKINYIDNFLGENVINQTKLADYLKCLDINCLGQAFIDPCRIEELPDMKKVNPPVPKNSGFTYNNTTMPTICETVLNMPTYSSQCVIRKGSSVYSRTEWNTNGQKVIKEERIFTPKEILALIQKGEITFDKPYNNEFELNDIINTLQRSVREGKLEFYDPKYVSEKTSFIDSIIAPNKEFLRTTEYFKKNACEAFMECKVECLTQMKFNQLFDKTKTLKEFALSDTRCIYSYDSLTDSYVLTCNDLCQSYEIQETGNCFIFTITGQNGEKKIEQICPSDISFCPDCLEMFEDYIYTEVEKNIEVKKSIKVLKSGFTQQDYDDCFIKKCIETPTPPTQTQKQSSTETKCEECLYMYDLVTKTEIIDNKTVTTNMVLHNKIMIIVLLKNV